MIMKQGEVFTIYVHLYAILKWLKINRHGQIGYKRSTILTEHNLTMTEEKKYCFVVGNSMTIKIESSFSSFFAEFCCEYRDLN